MIDKAGKAYWQEVWTSQQSTSLLARKSRPVADLEKRFGRFFESVLSGIDTSGLKLLEAGCGSSNWLSYFARDFGFEVSGIDYSEAGCARVSENLLRQKIAGEIVCADFRNPPKQMRNAFDILFSSGVVEHYTDTVACVEALSELLKPGGMMITNIPNLNGLCGWLQRAYSRTVFDVHVPLDAQALAEGHERAGLTVDSCDYFLSTNFGVVNPGNLHEQPLAGGLKKATLGALTRVSYLVLKLEDRLTPIPPNRFSSPYINCVARKKLA
jgi:2-polyprenyl-3-methyl-5-hydroxy-6-metoxy-1,4-benzoquinol methylase